jgi:hypothetical protein
LKANCETKTAHATNTFKGVMFLWPDTAAASGSFRQAEDKRNHRNKPTFFPVQAESATVEEPWQATLGRPDPGIRSLQQGERATMVCCMVAAFAIATLLVSLIYGLA